MCSSEPRTYEEFGWTVTPLTGTFGAELSGRNLRDEEGGDNVRTLLERHLVLSFRGQNLTHAEQSRIAHAMGEPTPAHPVVPGHPDYPEMLVLDGALGGKNARWHTDVTFIETPPAISILVNDHTPVAGGDTLWSDTRAAYERLHPALRETFEQLQAVHRISPLAYWGEPFDTALSREDTQYLYDEAQKVPPVAHPVVRRHPSTGRPSLFVNPGFTSHLTGVSRIESDHLLKLLYEHMAQPELTLRHHWLDGDVVMWDNRATMHYATDDYGTAERRMRRITLRGTKPVGIRGTESYVVTDPLESVR
jgi:alpha-ketoglutarate-dependent taurine dioxygenase